jgi:hypothetical protein
MILLVKSEKRSRVVQLVDSRRTGIALQSLIDSRKVSPHESEPETVTMEIEEFNDLAGGLDMEDVIRRAHTEPSSCGTSRNMARRSLRSTSCSPVGASSGIEVS